MQAWRETFFTRGVHNELFIAAPLERTWAVLADLEGFGDWNPVMTEVHGAVVMDGPVSVRFILGRPITVACRIDTLEPGSRLAWHGGPPGLLRGHHYFECHAADGGTRFIHGERFTGALVPLVWPLLGGRIEDAHARINAAFAIRVEQGAGDAG
jgi:hypothetical protein